MPNLGSLIPQSVSIEKGRNIMATTISVPLSWLIVIIAALLFNGGIMYSQFSEIKSNTAATTALTASLVSQISAVNARVDLISQRVTSGEGRATANDQRQTGEEERIRQIELNLASIISRMKLVR
jgi:hypothetical protein